MWKIRTQKKRGTLVVRSTHLGSRIARKIETNNAKAHADMNKYYICTGLSLMTDGLYPSMYKDIFHAIMIAVPMCNNHTRGIYRCYVFDFTVGICEISMRQEQSV